MSQLRKLASVRKAIFCFPFLAYLIYSSEMPSATRHNCMNSTKKGTVNLLLSTYMEESFLHSRLALYKGSGFLLGWNYSALGGYHTTEAETSWLTPNASSYCAHPTTIVQMTKQTTSLHFIVTASPLVSSV